MRGHNGHRGLLRSVRSHRDDWGRRRRRVITVSVTIAFTIPDATAAVLELVRFLKNKENNDVPFAGTFVFAFRHGF
jgi:hypothetical protein